MTFSITLKNLRNENSLTQKQLGDILGISQEAIRGWENQGKEPSFEILCKIAKVFNVTVGQLLGVED